MRHKSISSCKVVVVVVARCSSLAAATVSSQLGQAVLVWLTGCLLWHWLADWLTGQLASLLLTMNKIYLSRSVATENWQQRLLLSYCTRPTDRINHGAWARTCSRRTIRALRGDVDSDHSPKGVALAMALVLVLVLALVLLVALLLVVAQTTKMEKMERKKKPCTPTLNAEHSNTHTPMHMQINGSLLVLKIKMEQPQQQRR